jgi:hypothetical protein
MSIQKPSSSEEEYIARQEAVAKHKAAVEKARKLQAAEQEELRKLHHMKCPKCGMDLEEMVVRGVRIDKCHHCNGTWLDAGELETLAGHGSDVLSRIADIFRR